MCSVRAPRIGYTAFSIKNPGNIADILKCVERRPRKARKPLPNVAFTGAPRGGKARIEPSLDRGQPSEPVNEKAKEGRMKIERIRQDIPILEPSREPNTAPNAIESESDGDTKAQYRGGKRHKNAPASGTETAEGSPPPSRSDSFFVDLVV